jgi:hypothetical protein
LFGPHGETIAREPIAKEASPSIPFATENLGLAIVVTLLRNDSFSVQRITMHKFQSRRPTGVFRMRFHFAMSAVIMLGLATHSIEAADYKYPYRDPYLATATTAILSDEGATASVTSTIIRVPGLPGRNNLPDLEGRGDVSLALYRQNRPAPLLFILAGLGSDR